MFTGDKDDEQSCQCFLLIYKHVFAYMFEVVDIDLVEKDSN